MSLQPLDSQGQRPWGPSVPSHLHPLLQAGKPHTFSLGPHTSGILPPRICWDAPLVSSLERGSPPPLGAAPLPRRGSLSKASSAIRVKSEAFNQELPEYFPDLIHVFLQTIQITVDQLQIAKGKRRAVSQLIHTPLHSRK